MEAISLASAGLTHGTLTSRQLKFIRKKVVRGAPAPVAWCVPSPARLLPPIPSFFLGEVLWSPDVERGASSRARGGRARPRVRESHRTSRARSTPRFVFHLPSDASLTHTRHPSRPNRVFFPTPSSHHARGGRVASRPVARAPIASGVVRWRRVGWHSGPGRGIDRARSSYAEVPEIPAGDFGDARRRRMLEKTLEECEVDECRLDYRSAADGLAEEEEEEEEEEGEMKDDRLQKDGLHTTLLNWLVHRLPGQSRQKLPKIVYNETDNRSCWALAFCGFLWTSSTCMVFSLLPVFLKTELGYSNTRIGAMEGASLLISNLSRVGSGVISDIIKSRVKVIALGSAMTASMKLVLASAVSPQWVMSAKLLDRFGKGVRAAPTDALIADLSPRQKRSTTYGLHQSLTTLGGVFGSMCAVACMTLTANNYRLTFTLAAVPSVFAIFMLMYYVKKPNRLQTKHYGMPKFPARPAPSKRRHGRGPLAMVYEPVRWRRSQCKDKGRDRAWDRSKRTWRRVSDWLTEHLDDMKRRAQRVKEKRPDVLLFPQLSRREGEGEDDWRERQREWEAEYLSSEEEQKYRSLRGLRNKLRLGSPPPDAGMTADDLAASSASALAVETAISAAKDGIINETAPAARLRNGAGAVALEGAPATEEKKVAWGSWRWSFSEAFQLPWEFWRALLVFTVLKVARFSEAFVTLHANAVGLKAAYLPMLMVATNLMQSLLTYPLGVIADRVDKNGVHGNGRKFMLLGGFGMMIVADLVLVMAKAPWQVFVGYVAVGVHMSMTQANMKAALSATMPPNVRGTGFAISALTQGIALASGNYMAGRLCDMFGSAGAFWGGGFFATAALGLGWLLL